MTTLDLFYLIWRTILKIQKFADFQMMFFAISNSFTWSTCSHRKIVLMGSLIYTCHTYRPSL